MKDLSFSTGVVQFSLNGKIDVCFNPTDPVFVEKLYDTFDVLDKKQKEYAEKAESMKDNGPELFDMARSADAEMRELIDNTLGAPVCDALFGDISVYAMADGLPLWANLFLAIIDEIDLATGNEKKASSARIKKYTEKYHR